MNIYSLAHMNVYSLFRTLVLWCTEREVKQIVQTAFFYTIAEDDDHQASKRTIKTP